MILSMFSVVMASGMEKNAIRNSGPMSHDEILVEAYLKIRS